MRVEFTLIYLSWLLLWILVLVLRYRSTIVACWREPVLSKPVLIFESDDWGPGLPEDANQLESIMGILGKYCDSIGNNPVMTLGIILAVPDSACIKATNYKSYYRKTLDEVIFSSILKKIFAGVNDGVFSVQLHGMEHYWPDNLMTSLQVDENFKALLDYEYPLKTEKLPNAMQSRWVKIDEIRGNQLNVSEIQLAVKEEADMFVSIFHQSARVVVPPTFVWSHEVEVEWKNCGLKYLVTPGVMCHGRDNKGEMTQSDKVIYNGLCSSSGLLYLVRNDYFEPALGHTPADALRAIICKTKLGRPSLLEIHRFNFSNLAEEAKKNCEALDLCIKTVLKKIPHVRFMSTEELGDIYARQKDTDLIDDRFLIRVVVFMERIWACQAMRKWLYLSSLFLFVKSIAVLNKCR